MYHKKRGVLDIMLTKKPGDIGSFGVVTRINSMVRFGEDECGRSKCMKQNLPPLALVLLLMLLPLSSANTPPNQTTSTDGNATQLASGFYLEPSEFIIMRSTPKTLDMYVNFDPGEDIYRLTHELVHNDSGRLEQDNWLYYPDVLYSSTWNNKSIPIIITIPDSWDYGNYEVKFNITYLGRFKYQTSMLLKVRSEESLMQLEEGQIEGGVFKDTFMWVTIATIGALVIIIYISYKKYL